MEWKLPAYQLGHRFTEKGLYASQRGAGIVLQGAAAGAKWLCLKGQVVLSPAGASSHCPSRLVHRL